MDVSGRPVAAILRGAAGDGKINPRRRAALRCAGALLGALGVIIAAAAAAQSPPATSHLAAALGRYAESLAVIAAGMSEAARAFDAARVNFAAGDDNACRELGEAAELIARKLQTVARWNGAMEGALRAFLDRIARHKEIPNFFWIEETRGFESQVDKVVEQLEFLDRLLARRAPALPPALAAIYQRAIAALGSANGALAQLGDIDWRAPMYDPPGMWWTPRADQIAELAGLADKDRAIGERLAAAALDGLAHAPCPAPR